MMLEAVRFPVLKSTIHRRGLGPIQGDYVMPALTIRLYCSAAGRFWCSEDLIPQQSSLCRR
ncbi:MAG: hypothetical protein EBS69_09765, partial [Verrucomicrobia bacterium]|nr:hypothetical protein [Verrucomicrobiota bacterium]